MSSKIMNTNHSKILTLNPNSKKGVNMDLVKYDRIKNAILQILSYKNELLTTELSQQVKEQLEGKFDGKIGWYFMAVKLDLESRRIIKKVPNKTPQMLTIV